MNSQFISSAKRVILSEKEYELSIIEKLVTQNPAGCVIEIGVNVVYLARELLSSNDIRQYALQKLCAAFSKAGIAFTQYIDSEYTFLLVSDSGVRSIKRICCDIEEGYRLLDIDVYDAHGCVSRLDIGLSERKCFLCDEAASWCIFNEMHSAEELLEYTLTYMKNDSGT